jgi:ABC-type Fe3+-siderophore transport system permease subunit
MAVDLQATAKFGVADAASTVRAYNEQTHRFWGYFQLAGAGTAAFAWTGKDTHDWSIENREIILIGLLIAFLCFALANMLLAVGSQRAAWIGYEAIRKFKEDNASEIDPTLGEVLLLSRPVRPWVALFWHFAITLAVFVAVLASPLGQPVRLFLESH